MPYISSFLKPQQAYTRMPGVASGMGQKQPQTCPTGYRWDTAQGRCVAVNIPKQGFWNQVSQGINNRYQPAPQQPVARQPLMPAPGQMGTVPRNEQRQQFIPQQMPKPSNQLSPYANLIAQAIDLNPPLQGITQPYVQQQPSQPDYMAYNQQRVHPQLQNLLFGGTYSNLLRR